MVAWFHGEDGLNLWEGVYAPFFLMLRPGGQSGFRWEAGLQKMKPSMTLKDRRRVFRVQEDKSWRKQQDSSTIPGGMNRGPLIPSRRYWKNGIIKKLHRKHLINRCLRQNNLFMPAGELIGWHLYISTSGYIKRAGDFQ